MKYRIYNNTDNEIYFKSFDNYTECYNWIVNHLNLSKNWNVDYKVKRLITETRVIK